MKSAPRDGTEVDLWCTPFTGTPTRFAKVWWVPPYGDDPAMWRNDDNSVRIPDHQRSGGWRPKFWRPAPPDPIL